MRLTAPMSVSLFPIEELCKRLGEMSVHRSPMSDDLELRSRSGHVYLFPARDYQEVFGMMADLCEAIDLYADGSIVFA